MNYTTLGRTGLKVSRLCLGTMNFGPQTSEEDSHRIMDRAIELGINFFDTADVYGWKKGEGVTESIVGRWFAGGSSRREKAVLATKVFGDMDQDPQDITMKRGLSALKIRRACDNSLKRLQSDYIDLYQMHHISRETPWEEVWQAMDTLVTQGKILYVGSSNFAGWHIAQAQEAAHHRHFMGLVSEQSKYSLMDRMIEMEVVPACKHYGLGILPWSPLAGGALGGVLDNPNEGRRKGLLQQEWFKNIMPKIQKWEGLCKELGEAPANVALAWLVHQEQVTAPIIGPRTMDQFNDTMRALEIKLSAETLKKLDELFPGYKPAPEQYAW